MPARTLRGKEVGLERALPLLPAHARRMPKKSRGKKNSPSSHAHSSSRQRNKNQEAPADTQEAEEFQKLQELLEDETQPLDVAKTPLEHLLSLRQPQELALRLAQSLISLRSRLAELELERLNNEHGVPGRSDAVARRAQEKAEKLELEICKTERVSRRLLLMSRVVGHIIGLRKDTIAAVGAAMEAEVRSLREQIEANEEVIRGRFVDRVNMLHRYWLWRTLQELGDQTVSRTFEEELSRGPRYRSLGVQNNILSDTLEQQLSWLVRFAERERLFREHVRRLDTLVEELTDVNEALEEALTCRVCGLFFEDPVVFWPCGHTFCLACFDSLSIAPSLFRCPTCGSMGSEGYVHSLLIAECVAKWMFKDSGYADIHGALSLIRLHLSKFRKEVISTRIAQLRQRLAEAQYAERKPEELADMDVEFRSF
ncbi:uncharacterized protein Tco025E_01030 [Trypanosoma conorhini]|uniref:RING-type domain-containing protein n=1 Tax=Trypanosoma conorhini TaxID=83891 RepID=A0A3R7LEA1_9TRYP|nr:uncharacterized protein Tco025E_01030 [Trypanosoma conorhini]RNF26705.1 hypothetical protein Tco025E_01030 [Trypanosoma conorhini]